MVVSAIRAAAGWELLVCSAEGAGDCPRAVPGIDSGDRNLRELQRAQAEQTNMRMLRIVAENPALKNGMELLLLRPKDREARRTVEDQLTEIHRERGA